MQQLNLFALLNGGQAQDSPTQNLIIAPKTFELRDYQKELKSHIYQLIRDGYKRILVYAPTGSGKTAILSSISSDCLSKNKRLMLIVHRDFLVEQSRTAMIKTGIDSNNIGIIKAGYKEDRDRPIQIAELQGYPPRYVQNGTHCKVLLRIQQKNCDLQGFQSLKPALNFRPHPTKVAQSPYQSGNHQTA